MKYRKLRFAWSVIWSAGAVLLIALWARSYWKVDEPKWFGVQFVSDRGQLFINTFFEARLREASGRERVKVTDKPGSRKGFPWKPYGKYLAIRYSPIIFVAGTLAAIPWLPWSKRFSLRALLIATTLIAVVLGLIVSSVHG